MKILIQRKMFCKNFKCKDYGKSFTGRIRIASRYKVFYGTVIRIEYKCDTCGKHFSETKGTIYYRRKKTPEQIHNVLEHSVRGVGVNDTAELVKMTPNTVENIIFKAGNYIENWYSEQNIILSKGNIEYDEQWTFVLKKNSDNENEGEVWIWISFHRETRFMIYFVIGNHSSLNGQFLVEETKERIEHPSKHYTDELSCYKGIFEKIYNSLPDVDETGQYSFPFFDKKNVLNYATVNKTRKGNRIINVEKCIHSGDIKVNEISTNHIERLNLNNRQDNSRLVRKTLKFSKSILYLIYSFWIYFFYYNYRKPHKSLRQLIPEYDRIDNRKWLKRTPAMETDIHNKVLDWNIPLSFFSGFV